MAHSYNFKLNLNYISLFFLQRKPENQIKAQFTDLIRLSLTNDIRDEKNLAIDDIDISFIKGATEVSSRLNDKIYKVSKGRVSDADNAVEGSNLAKNQILSQGSLAMLAQANRV